MLPASQGKRVQSIGNLGRRLLGVEKTSAARLCVLLPQNVTGVAWPLASSCQPRSIALLFDRGRLHETTTRGQESTDRGYLLPARRGTGNGLGMTCCGNVSQHCQSRLYPRVVRCPSLTAPGVNLTLKVQLEPAATLLPHVLVWAKSDASLPVRRTLEILKIPLAWLVKVTIWAALVVPLAWLPKFRLVGDSVTAVPTPVSEPVCGPSGALSMTVSAPVSVPGMPKGPNFTWITQLAPAGRLSRMFWFERPRVYDRFIPLRWPTREELSRKPLFLTSLCGNRLADLPISTTRGMIHHPLIRG